MEMIIVVTKNDKRDGQRQLQPKKKVITDCQL